MLKSSFYLFLVSVFVSLLFTTETNACWCRGISSCEAFNHSSAVFVGRVLSVTNKDKPDDGEKSIFSNQAVRFQILEKFQGKKSRTITVETGGEWDCDRYHFQIGETYLVYAYSSKNASGLRTGQCGGTKPFAKAEEDLTFLRGLPEANSGGRVSGTVIGYGFNQSLNKYEIDGLSNISITISRDGKSKTILTDASGNYEFTGIKTGAYEIKVSLPNNYEIASYGDEANRKIDVGDRGCVSENFHLKIKNSLEGILLNEAGVPLKDIEITLLPVEKLQNEESDEESLEVDTDENGKFSFKQINPGRYVIAINYDEEPDEDFPYLPTFYPNVTDAKEAIVIEFGLEQKHEKINLKFTERLTERKITGKVFWFDGRPAIKSIVQFWRIDDVNGDYLTGLVKTDEKGNFEIKGFSGLDYKLKACSYRNKLIYGDGMLEFTNPLQSDYTDIKLKDDLTDINLTLKINCQSCSIFVRGSFFLGGNNNLPVRVIY